MKNPFKKLSKKVKRGALIALVTVAAGMAGIHLNPVTVANGVDIGIQVYEEVTADDK